MAARKTSKSAKQPTKSDFVRSLPGDMPGKEVVAKAKARGINLTLPHVYEIRSVAKRAKAGGKVGRVAKVGVKASGGSGGKGAKRGPGTSTSAAARFPAGSVEARFVNFVGQIGLGRVHQLVRQLRAGLRGIRIRLGGVGGVPIG